VPSETVEYDAKHTNSLSYQKSNRNARAILPVAKLNKAKSGRLKANYPALSRERGVVNGSVSGSGSLEITKKLDNFEEFQFAVAAAGVVAFAARVEKQEKVARRRPPPSS